MKKELFLENNSMHYPMQSPDNELLHKLTNILSLISKQDALQLFVMAKNGFKSEVDSYSKIGLTRKQYYTRLKQLIDIGLLAKNEDQQYVHTTLGEIVYDQHLLKMLDYIQKSKDLEMVDVLKQSSKFSQQDIDNFLSKIGIVRNDSTQDKQFVSNSVMTTTFDDMVLKILEMIEFARKEILLITRFSNDLIINSLLKKSNMGITTKILADTKMVENYFGVEKAYDDKNKTERITVISNPFYPSKVSRRYVQVPFCAMVVDGNYVGIEIVNSINPTKFERAFFVRDTTLSDHVKELFANLWEAASENPPQVINTENPS